MAGLTRRRALLASSSVLTAGIAGCSALLEGELEALGADEDTKEPEQRIEELETKLTEREERIEELESLTGSYYDQETIDVARDVMYNAKDAVVYFDTGFGDGVSSGGTGWFIDEYTIVTNGHVIEAFYEGEADYMDIYTRDGDTLSFTIEGAINTHEVNRTIDMGIIKTDESAPKTLNVGSTESVEVGDPLVQVGHPGMIGNWVGALGERISSDGDHTSLRMEMPSKSGNSGSPIMTLDGIVIGCMYSGSPRQETTQDGAPRTDMTELYMTYPEREATTANAQPTETIDEYYQKWN